MPGLLARAGSWLLHQYMRVGRTHRLGALAGGTLVVAVLLGLHRFLPALAAAALVALMPLGRVAQWLGRRRRLRDLASQQWPTSPVPPAADTLARMGLDPATVGRLLAAARREPEVLIATFDQNNRVTSEVGRIPLFDGWAVSPAEFKPRARNRLELVVFRGVVAIKKTYRDRVGLDGEATALHALAGLEGVPRIVFLRRDARVLYQSFLPGENLGSVMARRGATVSLQHRVAAGYPGSSRWDAGLTQPPERAACLEALGAVMGEASIGALRTLLAGVHRAGVVVHDVKYGNVILLDGKPHLCDFDDARAYLRTSLRFLAERERERDTFNYVFGGGGRARPAD